jgi:hypothetical protein
MSAIDRERLLRKIAEVEQQLASLRELLICTRR